MVDPLLLFDNKRILVCIRRAYRLELPASHWVGTHYPLLLVSYYLVSLSVNTFDLVQYINESLRVIIPRSFTSYTPESTRTGNRVVGFVVDSTAILPHFHGPRLSFGLLFA